MDLFGFLPSYFSDFFLSSVGFLTAFLSDFFQIRYWISLWMHPFRGLLWLPKWLQSGSTWLIIMYHTPGKCFRVIWGLPGQHLVRSSPLSQWATERTRKSQFCHTEKFLMVVRSGFFPDGLVTPKSHFGAIRANLKMVFLRKIHFLAYPILPKNCIFLGLRGPFWPKTSKT